MYPKRYKKDIIFSRFEFDPLFYIDKNTIAFLFYEQNYTPVKVTFNQSSCIVESKGNDELIKREVERVFDLKTDFEDIYYHLKTYPYFDALKEHIGKPLCLDTGLYEALLRGVIHQQISMKGAYTLTKRLIDAYGVEIDGIKGLPRPEVIAELSIEDLRVLKFNTSKADYMIRICKMIASDEINLEEIATKDIEEVYKILLPIKGIGKWTIHSFMLFGAGYKNLFMKQDLGVMNAIKNIEGLDERPSTKEMKEIETNFKAYKSYVTFYLWYCL